MSRTLRIVERGQNDVDAIFDWLARRSARGAIAWYMAFRRKVGEIATGPESYGEAPEGPVLDRTLRQAQFKTRRGRVYRIVFKVFDTEILILRIRGPGQPALRSRDLPGP